MVWVPVLVVSSCTVPSVDVAFLLAIPASSALAQSNDEILKRLDALEKTVDALKKENAALRKQNHPKAPVVATQSARPNEPVVAASATSATVVTEASMKPTQGYYAAAPTPVPGMSRYNWTGFYVGANVGHEWGQLQGRDSMTDASNGTPGFLSNTGVYLGPDSQSIDGWFGGGQVGFNYQIRHVVIGTELSASGGDIDAAGNCFSSAVLPGFGATGTLGCKAKQDWTVNWLNKLGWAFGPEDRLLTYAIGGITATGVSINRQSTTDFGVGSISEQWSGNQTLVGLVIGAGVQYAFGDAVTMGFEYLHSEYASANITTHGTSTCSGPISCGPPLPPAASASDQLRTDAVRAVLNYKLTN